MTTHNNDILQPYGIKESQSGCDDINIRHSPDFDSSRSESVFWEHVVHKKVE